MEPLTAYPFGQPSNVIEPLDLADVKSYLSITDSDTSQDAFLTDAMTMCRATLEQYLPGYVITGTVKARCMIQPGQANDETTIAIKGPVRTITGATVTLRGEQPSAVSSYIIDEGLISADLSGLTETARFDVTYTVGSSIDYRVRAVLLTMIRNRYDRRYEDPFTDEVRRMAYPLMRINI